MYIMLFADLMLWTHCKNKKTTLCPLFFTLFQIIRTTYHITKYLQLMFGENTLNELCLPPPHPPHNRILLSFTRLLKKTNGEMVTYFTILKIKNLIFFNFEKDK